MKVSLFVLLLFLLACNIITTDQKTVERKGNQIHISGFSHIRSSIAADIHIEMNPDSPYQCFLQCEKSIAALIVFDMVNDQLHIRAKDDESINTREPIIITMRIRDLQSIDNDGSGRISVKGALTAHCVVDNQGSGAIQLHDVHNQHLEANVMGSGSIRLVGDTKELLTKITGSGHVNAFDLHTEATDATVVGSGSVEVSVSNTLDADIAGSGNIYYRGKPAVRTSISGSGSVIAQQ